MKTNNQTKPKNKIFIIWGLFITGVILIFLIFLLLVINKSQSKTDNQNQPNLNSKTNPQQEQETYKKLMNKIEKEINDLTNKKETFYQPDGTTISKIEIKNAEDKLIKRIVYKDDGKTINWIKEFDPQTSLLIKNTVHDNQGKIIQIIKFKPSRDYIIEVYDPQTSKKIQENHYKKDGSLEKEETFN